MSRRHSLPYCVRSQDGTEYVYGLVDPRINAVFYIGVTRDPATRYSAHCTQTDTGTAKDKVIEEIGKSGSVVEMWILAECDNRDDALAVEAFFIEMLMDQELCANTVPGKYWSNVAGSIELEWSDRAFLNLALPSERYTVRKRRRGRELTPERKHHLLAVYMGEIEGDSLAASRELVDFCLHQDFATA